MRVFKFIRQLFAETPEPETGNRFDRSFERCRPPQDSLYATNPPQSFDGRHCYGYKMAGGYFHHVNFSGADLRGSDMRFAHFRNADLAGTNLRDADLSFADLSGADLRGADLTNTNLRDANLSGALLG